MAVFLKHIDFEVPGWGELDAGPTARRGCVGELLADGPEAVWRLDETAGPTAYDLVGDRSLTYHGGVGFGEPGPLIDDDAGAACFDGADGYADRASDDLLSGVEACTITFWMRYDAASVEADAAVLSRWAVGATGMMVWVDKQALYAGTSATLTFAVNIGTEPQSRGRVEGPSGLIRPGRWDFYACVFSGGDHLRLYRGSADLDLALVAENTQVWSQSPALSQPLRLGVSSSPAAIGHLPAALANVAVYHAALSEERLAAQFNAGVGRWA